MHPLLAQAVFMPEENGQPDVEQAENDLASPLLTAEPIPQAETVPNTEEALSAQATLPTGTDSLEEASVTVAGPQSPSTAAAPANGTDADEHPFDSALAALKKQTNKPTKIYVGNLPNQTKEEDLEGCFSELGKIVSVELKVGYGFVEFETKDEAERAVQKYDGGLFLGNKIRCELSHGGAKVAKFSGEPGICFKCRQSGHWARECPNAAVDPNWVDHHKGEKRNRRHDHNRHREELAPYPMRTASGYREDTRGDHRGMPASRDLRFDEASRDHRYGREGRPMSPPGRTYSRDFDDMRSGIPRPPVAGAYDARMPPDPRGFDVRGSMPYDARGSYGGYPDYDRPPVPPRDYPPTPLSAGAYDRGMPPYGVMPPYMNSGRPRSPLPYDTRDMPSSTGGYDPYRGRGGYPTGGQSIPSNRYDPYSRRRSMSPPARSVPPSSSYGGYDAAGAPPPIPPPNAYSGSGAGGPPYRPQDYPAPPPPSNGYYDPTANSMSMYGRGGQSAPGANGGPGNDREGAGADRRFAPENGRPSMSAYDRR